MIFGRKYVEKKSNDFILATASADGLFVSVGSETPAIPANVEKEPNLEES